MTQQEYEERIGEKVSAEEFDTADRIYMCSCLDKDEFCEAYKHINPSTFKLVKDLADGVHSLNNRASEVREKLNEAEGKLYRLGQQLANKASQTDDRELRDLARELMGDKYYPYCVENNLLLTQCDRDRIVELLNTAVYGA
ncbi:MAG: hypothetical protein IKP37_02495 [Paludibacteraceae bacterium]|nr:hypothetical protein [Paludibacteraceae bacterium]